MTMLFVIAILALIISNVLLWIAVIGLNIMFSSLFYDDEDTDG